MSGDPNPKSPEAAPADPLTGMWARLFEQSNSQFQVVLDLMKSAGDPQELQRRWLDALGQSLESFMRTPAFLESMQRNLKVMNDLKMMQDRTVGDAARQLGMPLASDVTGLFERVNSLERGIMTRLKAIEAKLESIASDRS